MNARTKILLSAAFAIGLAGAPQALAQAAASATVTAGAVVKDPAGGDVGTITAVDGEFAVLKTDKHEVRLPVSSFAQGEGAFVMGMTRAELNAEVEKLSGAAVLAVGATVRDANDGVVGTIEEFDAELATVKLPSTKLVKLPVSAFGRGPNGPVIGSTAAELEAAAGGAAPTSR
jgi:hypothetical protein